MKRTTTRKGQIMEDCMTRKRSDQVGLYDKGHDKEKDRSWRTV